MNRPRRNATVRLTITDREVPRSFISEILKVALDPSVVSFAGRLAAIDVGIERLGRTIRALMRGTG